MSRSRLTILRRIGVGAVGVSAVALPLQAATAHASTPNEDLSACVDSAIATMGDNFTANIDACVQAYMQELGADRSAGTVGTVTTTDGSVTTTDGSVNTGILGTVDDGSTVTVDGM